MIYGDHNNGEIEIVDEKPVVDNKYVTIYNDDVIFPEGNVGTYCRIKYKAPFCVAVIPIHANGDISIIKIYRHAARAWVFEIPKGMGNFNETPEEAAKRELVEETGLVSQTLKHIGTYYESPALLSNTLHCFIAYNCEKINEINTEDTETIGNRFTGSFQDVINMITQSEVIDAISELLIMKWGGCSDG